MVERSATENEEVNPEYMWSHPIMTAIAKADVIELRINRHS